MDNIIEIDEIVPLCNHPASLKQIREWTPVLLKLHQRNLRGVTKGQKRRDRKVRGGLSGYNLR